MANYADYTDVELRKYALTGETLSETQQTLIESLLTVAHGIIKGFLGVEPSTSDELKDIEVDLCLRMLWNAEHPDERPLDVLSTEIRARLNNLHLIPTSSEETIVGTINLRGWE